jgi:hypothetical protein
VRFKVIKGADTELIVLRDVTPRVVQEIYLHFGWTYCLIRQGRRAVYVQWESSLHSNFNPLNAELNPICHLLALLGAHHIVHVSEVRVKRFLRMADFLAQNWHFGHCPSPHHNHHKQISKCRRLDLSHSSGEKGKSESRNTLLLGALEGDCSEQYTDEIIGC